MENIEKINYCYKTKDKVQLIDNISDIYKHVLREKKWLEILQEHRNQHPYTNKNQKLNFKFPRSLSFNTLNNIDIDFELLQNLEDMNLNNSSISTRNNSLNSIFGDPILSKNINFSDEVIKFIVVGDYKVGKSFFVNKLLNDNTDPNNYTHTSCFEIKKKMIKLMGKSVKLELWDTNTEIINSEISTSNLDFYLF
jgi:hypothetical protein